MRFAEDDPQSGYEDNAESGYEDEPHDQRWWVTDPLQA